MACVEQATSGGDSIIAYTNKIYRDLKKNNKKILKTLKEKIIFEIEEALKNTVLFKTNIY